MALLNANSGLQNDLDDERAKLAAVMAQVHLLQSQLAAHQLGQEDWEDGCEDTPMNIRGGGCYFTKAADSEGLVVASSWAGVGGSSDSFGSITSSSPNNLGVGQGNGASPMAQEAFNSFLGTLVDNPRATPLGGVVHVPSKVSNQVYVRLGRMSHGNIFPQEESFDNLRVHEPLHVNLWRTEEEQTCFPGYPQQDLPLEKERLYYPGYALQDHPGYAPQDHPLAMPVHRAISRLSPANLPNQDTPPSDMDCGSDGGGGVRE
jgi:hypothetical protein